MAFVTLDTVEHWSYDIEPVEGITPEQLLAIEEEVGLVKMDDCIYRGDDSGVLVGRIVNEILSQEDEEWLLQE